MTLDRDELRQLVRIYHAIVTEGADATHHALPIVEAVPVLLDQLSAAEAEVARLKMEVAATGWLAKEMVNHDPGP